MNRKQAIAKLKTIVGPKLGYHEPRNALDAEGRAEQREIARSLRVEECALRTALDERRAELLSDPVYVDLRTRLNAKKAEADKAQARSHRKPIQVGKQGEVFFHILADGDTWAEIVEKMTKEAKP